MKATKVTGSVTGMSDAAVQAKTRKTWPQWFKSLDAAGAKKMAHREIVTLLHQRHKLGSWWAQMVTVGYERARGMREKHQKPEGFEISSSKTVAAPLATLYQAWQDEKARTSWLAAKSLVIRRATSNKSMRLTWGDGRTSLIVDFYPKGDGKSQVTVQHGKLPDAKAAERMKTYWGKTLAHLKDFLEAP